MFGGGAGGEAEIGVGEARAQALLEREGSGKGVVGGGRVDSALSGADLKEDVERVGEKTVAFEEGRCFTQRAGRLGRFAVQP
ncbi:hypothetical protein ABT142_11515 [Streptomyces sp. NPDC001857]